MTNQDKVKLKHPNAVCERDGALFFITIGAGDNKKDLGTGMSEKEAWTSAFSNKLNSKKL